MPRHAPAVGASFLVMMNNQRCRLDGDAVRRPLERSIQNESKNPYEARRQVAGSARACLPCLPSQGGIGRGQDRGSAEESSTRAGGGAGGGHQEDLESTLIRPPRRQVRAACSVR